MKLGFAATVLVVGVFVACGGKKPRPPEEPSTVVTDAGVETGVPEAGPQTLFERLGKMDGLKGLVDSFVENMLADAAVNKLFAKTKGDKLDHFKSELVFFFCKETGGDCTYSGKTMKEAHRGMKITEKQWDAVVSDMKLALDEHKVEESVRTELFGLIGPLRDDIVEVKAKPKK